MEQNNNQVDLCKWLHMKIKMFTGWKNINENAHWNGRYDILRSNEKTNLTDSHMS